MEGVEQNEAFCDSVVENNLRCFSCGQMSFVTDDPVAWKVRGWYRCENREIQDSS